MRVIIFDGVCSLCNASVDFIIRRDIRNQFKFTANQNESGKTLLEEHGIDPERVETIYFYENGRMYTKSTAVLRIARYLPFPYPLAYIFILVPPFLRNWVYDLVARNRYRWFGKKETCRIPSPEERAKFLA